MGKSKDTVNDFLEYVQKKGRGRLSTAFQDFINYVKSANTYDQIVNRFNTFVISITSIPDVEVKSKVLSAVVTVNFKDFNVYFDKNKHGNSFLVVEYKRKGEARYFYQLIPKHISITSYG